MCIQAVPPLSINRNEFNPCTENSNIKRRDKCEVSPGLHSTDRQCGDLAALRPLRWPRERKIPGSNPACAGIFSGPSRTSDLKIGTPVATLPGAWRSRVSAGTGRPGVGIL